MTYGASEAGAGHEVPHAAIGDVPAGGLLEPPPEELEEAANSAG